MVILLMKKAKLIGWIVFGTSKEVEDDYNGFIKSVDTIIMGNKTYRQIMDELSVNQWPYKGLKTYVYSHNKLASNKNKQLEFTSESPKELLKRISLGSKGIWLVGGSKIIRLFLKDKVIDELIISIIPKLLGKGIPLFTKDYPKSSFKVECVEKLGDIAQITFKKNL